VSYSTSVTARGRFDRVGRIPFPRHVFVVLTLLVAAALATGPGPASAGTRAGTRATKAHQLRNQMFQLVNHSRRHHGKRPLKINWRLSRFAHAHSARMARRHRVYHSADVWRLVRRFGAHRWGENVGMAGTLRRMELLFMRSPEHRANILSTRFRHMGVGAVRARGRVWVTLDFYG
jgi:uncharacterized protein YkwD